ncbi:replication initiation factor [Anopheles sinensis]|uniref:Replication initiation factor n=1 Tax=Anopheles sinensis TaxID=74873 RepID=A0A084W7P5_ANOSI|nr:replication initiation factor [Anopheles sinensis]
MVAKSQQSPSNGPNGKQPTVSTPKLGDIQSVKTPDIRASGSPTDCFLSVGKVSEKEINSPCCQSTALACRLNDYRAALRLIHWLHFIQIVLTPISNRLLMIDLANSPELAANRIMNGSVLKMMKVVPTTKIQHHGTTWNPVWART